MPSYHSKIGETTEVAFEEACGCALMPFRTDTRGPAPPCNPGTEDIIDETIAFFRANVFFRNFEVKGGPDRTLIYLTLYFQQCLVKCERCTTPDAASKELSTLAMKAVTAPGEPGWVLGGMYPSGKSKQEGDSFKAYFKQAREEIGRRVVPLLYSGEGGSKNKWWQAFSKRKFMGKELRD
jgi:actin related protein 2/3 complex subunit 3